LVYAVGAGQRLRAAEAAEAARSSAVDQPKTESEPR